MAKRKYYIILSKERSRYQCSYSKGPTFPMQFSHFPYFYISHRQVNIKLCLIKEFFLKYLAWSNNNSHFYKFIVKFSETKLHLTSFLWSCKLVSIISTDLKSWFWRTTSISSLRRQNNITSCYNVIYLGPFMTNITHCMAFTTDWDADLEKEGIIPICIIEFNRKLKEYWK